MCVMSFTDKDRIPGEKEFSGIIGDAFKIWNGIIGHVKDGYSPIREEWKFSGQKYGWQGITHCDYRWGCEYR